MTEKSSYLILSGYNIRAVIAFCRWAKLASVNFHIIAKNIDDPILLTEYKDNVFIVRESNQLTAQDVIEWISSISSECDYEKIVLLPSTEYFNRIILEKRDEIELSGGVIPLVNKDLYAQISDKCDFIKLCNEHGIKTPEEYVSAPKDYPFVAKPQKYLMTKNIIPHIIKSKNDWEVFKGQNDVSEFIFQKFISGESHYLLCYIARNGQSEVFSQKNLIQQEKGGSIVLATSSDFHHNDDSKKYIKMLSKVKYFGFIMIEVRWDKKKNESIMIEANPRLWGPMQFINDNRINFWEKFSRDCKVKFQPASVLPEKQEQYYFWSGGLSKNFDEHAYFDYSSDLLNTNLQTLKKTYDVFNREDTTLLFSRNL